MALKCKQGTCTNNKDTKGCKPMLEGLEDKDCPEGSVCYREHQLPYVDSKRFDLSAIF